jgi:hypothetical protein
MDRHTEELVAQLRASQAGRDIPDTGASEDDELASEELSVAAHAPEGAGPLP